jgi:tRNA(Ile)-lysidine synthase
VLDPLRLPNPPHPTGHRNEPVGVTLPDLVRGSIRRHALAGPDTRVVAAVSGGSGSVALVHLLHALQAAGDLRLVALAHFNHQLRPEADADQRFCVEIGNALQLPVLVGTSDVRADARREHRSLEDAARTARHAFFERARLQAGADVVALGHTRDDQAETFLLRLLRGAGARGLASMHPRNGTIIRPLLDCRRDALKAFLKNRCLTSVQDSSNTDVSITRNRVRAELMPLLVERFNPSVVDVLAGEADVAREDWAWLNRAVDALESCVSRREDNRVVIDSTALNSAHVAVARATLLRVMTAVAGGRSVPFQIVERALELSRGREADFDAPGQRVERIGSLVVLTGRPPGAIGRVRRDDAAVQPFRYPLSIPGEVDIVEAGCAIAAEVDFDEPISATACNAGPVVAVRRDLCGAALSVRNRRPGDRFQPVGLGGHKKLQDFFVDRKIDRPTRSRVPVVVDEADRIIWVAGYAVSDEFRVTDPAQAVIILRLKGVGGAV